MLLCYETRVSVFCLSVTHSLLPKADTRKVSLPRVSLMSFML